MDADYITPSTPLQAKTSTNPRRERVIAERLARGTTKYQVKWANYETKHNTWEPIEQLAGCEDMIAEFKEREKTRIAQLEEYHAGVLALRGLPHQLELTRHARAARGR